MNLLLRWGIILDNREFFLEMCEFIFNFTFRMHLSESANIFSLERNIAIVETYNRPLTYTRIFTVVYYVSVIC